MGKIQSMFLSLDCCISFAVERLKGALHTAHVLGRSVKLFGGCFDFIRFMACAPSPREKSKFIF